MKEKTILIIGAGIAGLSAGVYGQMNGYNTRIYELGSNPGGLCTTWKRKGYSFDGCIHWLNGSHPNSSLYRLWQELGAVQDREFINHDFFMQVITPAGRTVHLYSNIDRLEQHLLEVAPEDRKFIQEMAGDMRKISKMDIPLDGEGSVFKDILSFASILPVLLVFRKWSKINMKMLAGRFKNPDLQHVFRRVFDLPDAPAVGLVMTLAGMHRHDNGVPSGGSLPFSRAIEKRYLDLGGEIHYNTRVSKILVEKDTAVGLRFENGQEIRADLVLSAADGHATIFDMLDGKYIDDRIAGYYREMPIFKGIVQVSLGLKNEMKGVPHCSFQELPAPVTVGGVKQEYINTRIFNYDPTMAPTGRTVAQTYFEADYQFWKEISADRERYEAEKQQAAVAFIDHLETIYPGISGQVEVVDVSTPLTTERYTGNWQGSIEGWEISRRTMEMSFGKGMPKTLPGLKNFYMAGQWVEPGGGLPAVALSGRKFIQDLCKRDGRTFIATITG